MTGAATRNECEHISGIPVKKLSQPLDQFRHLVVPYTNRMSIAAATIVLFVDNQSCLVRGWGSGPLAKLERAIGFPVPARWTPRHSPGTLGTRFPGATDTIR